MFLRTHQGTANNNGVGFSFQPATTSPFVRLELWVGSLYYCFTVNWRLRDETGQTDIMTGAQSIAGGNDRCSAYYHHNVMPPTNATLLAGRTYSIFYTCPLTCYGSNVCGYNGDWRIIGIASVCNTTYQYQYQAPGPLDRVCRNISVCTANQFVSGPPPTATSDRNCTDHRICQVKF